MSYYGSRVTMCHRVSPDGANVSWLKPRTPEAKSWPLGVNVRSAMAKENPAKLLAGFERHPFVWEETRGIEAIGAQVRRFENGAGERGT
jgi:hypothetical protein